MDSFLLESMTNPCYISQAYNGDDYHGARIVSKACALRDAVQP